MIKTFANKETAAVFRGFYVKALPRDIQEKARRKLLQIHHVRLVDELRIPPGNRLERLSGDRAGQFSIRINEQWRICFEWNGTDALNVAIVDYH